MLLVRLLYKKFAIYFTLKKYFPLDNILSKQEIIAYDIKINYAKKENTGQKFDNYLGLKIFNSLNLNKKKYLRINTQINVNRYIS